MIKIYTAVLESDELANSNVALSKNDCNDSFSKEEINRAKTANLNAIKKYLNDGSSALTLKFVEKRVTRKRSGEIINNLLYYINIILIQLWRHRTLLEELNEWKHVGLKHYAQAIAKS